MDYIGVLSRFPSIVNDGRYYIKLDDAKFFVSEILKDKDKELKSATSSVPVLEWTKEDDDNLMHLIVLMDGVADDLNEGETKDDVLHLIDWLEDFKSALSMAGMRKEKEWNGKKNID